MSRLARDWRALGPEQRLAGAAAAALFVTMLLPWYQQNAVVSIARAAPLQSRNLNAFQVFSFVEAAVLLVALAVAYLLYARAEGREFHLPGSDGAVVMAAGLWTAALLVFRLFDKPGISSHGVAGNVGVQWGIFFAIAAAGLMTYAGSRMRAGRRPEAPLERAPTRRAARERASERDREEWMSAQAPERARAQLPDSGGTQPPEGTRPRYPPAPGSEPPQPPRRRAVAAVKGVEQLSLEDPPTEAELDR